MALHPREEKFANDEEVRKDATQCDTQVEERDGCLDGCTWNQE